ncbi:family transcriptional regulator, putative [Babesia ovata]|uniref:Family transcriptional regulator, putative n=1 Tax=Babesia ovata TaxID=189622 RepID=A0A2H6KFS4_9APIC|nr:family transcriptional regulator, putative [Babesia ovata]GBE61845.1 family transcriptional regulator, putative [Babesia ovata]
MSSNILAPGAIEEVVQLLGLDSAAAPTESDILKGKPSATETLHKWTVAITLGAHFRSHRSFVRDINPAKLDDAKLRVILESIGGETKCNTHDALNILTYTTLECLGYPRLTKISLDASQDAGEMFLAFVFLLSALNWFNTTEKKCPEYLEFRRCLVSAVDDEIGISQVSRLLESSGTDTKLADVGILLDRRRASQIDARAKEGVARSGKAASTKDEHLRGAAMIDEGARLHFLKASEPRGSGRVALKIDYTREETSSDHLTPLGSKGGPKLMDSSGGRNRFPIQSRIIGKPSSGNSLPHAKRESVGKELPHTGIEPVLLDVENAVSRVKSDFDAKSQLLCRSKNAETFDSELLRIIMGQSQQQVIFNNLMDNNVDVAAPKDDPGANKVIIGQRIRPGISADNTPRSVPSTQDEIKSLLDEIKELSNAVMQSQHRLKRLSHSVEHGDTQRLKQFASLSEDRKTYDKPWGGKNQETARQGSTYLNDSYSMPSPAEWLLISQKDPFDRHLALLKMIAKSLDNESKRSSIFGAALQVLKHKRPQASTKRASNSRVDSLGEKGKKGGFLNYLTSTLKSSVREGTAYSDDYTETKSIVEKRLHLFEEACKHDPMIEFAALPEWIHHYNENDAHEKTHVATADDGNQRHGESTISQREADDFERLQQLVNHDAVTRSRSDRHNAHGDTDPSCSKSILDFEYYFSLAREAYNTRESLDVMNTAPTFDTFGDVLNKHSAVMEKSKAASVLEAKHCLERVCEHIPTVTFLD